MNEYGIENEIGITTTIDGLPGSQKWQSFILKENDDGLFLYNGKNFSMKRSSSFILKRISIVSDHHLVVRFSFRYTHNELSVYSKSLSLRWVIWPLQELIIKSEYLDNDAPKKSFVILEGLLRSPA